MSFKTNRSQQLTVTDSYINLTARTQRIVMNSWAKDFADIVFPAIHEERFEALYSEHKFSRPNTPVNVIIGSLILKENSGLSDDELMESICCDVRYQYALHTTHLQEQPVSDRTFSRFRERLYHYELETGRSLLEEEMIHLADVYAEYMNLNSNIKRMDSLMVASNCKRMSRLEIIYATTANALRLLHRLGEDELIPLELRHFLDEEDYNKVIYHCKGEDVASRLEKAIREAELVKSMMSAGEWHDFSEYQLLIRVLCEQAAKDQNGNMVPKDNKDISPSSLQNPSDPDATFRKKAGEDYKGYVGNIIETVGEGGDSLITGIGYEQNTYSDSSFCKDYLENRPEGSEPEIMIADGAYSGKGNQELAGSKNTQLVPTALTGTIPNPIFADFKFSEDGKVILSCPMGHSPIKTTHYPKTGMCRSLFPVNCCGNCPNKEACRAKQQKKNFAVHASASMVDRANYAELLSTEEQQKLTKKRNAIEGVPSVLRRKYRVDDMPVFGYLRSKVFFVFKICAYNFNKLRRHNRRTRGKSAYMPAVA